MCSLVILRQGREIHYTACAKFTFLSLVCGSYLSVLSSVLVIFLMHAEESVVAVLNDLPPSTGTTSERLFWSKWATLDTQGSVFLSEGVRQQPAMATEMKQVEIGKETVTYKLGSDMVKNTYGNCIEFKAKLKSINRKLSTRRKRSVDADTH